MVKKKTTKKRKKKPKRNVLLNVVQIALEMLCFFKESTNLSDGPFNSSPSHPPLADGNERTQSRCLMTLIYCLITDFQYKQFVLASFSGNLNVKKAAFDYDSQIFLHKNKENPEIWDDSPQLEQHCFAKFKSLQNYIKCCRGWLWVGKKANLLRKQTTLLHLHLFWIPLLF